MSNIFPKCEICGLTPRFGLYDGFRIGKKFVCSECEKTIAETDVIHEMQYQANIQNIKRLLYG